MSVNRWDRWDPWRDLVSLREAMNGLLEESLVRPRPLANFGNGALIPLDLKDLGEVFSISVSLPGIDPEKVDISVLGARLRISGEFTQENAQPGQEQRWLIKERPAGRFDRAITLPSPVVADRAEARFDKGVLTIILPKADVARPKSIPVRGEAAVAETLPPVEGPVDNGAQSGPTLS